MFEHKNLDGTWNQLITSSQDYVKGDVLEMKESVSKETTSSTRKQYAVVGDRLVERCLPPQNVGDRWSYDAADEPWWVMVNNPPHVGLVASFNEFNGGEYRKPFNKERFVIGFAKDGEEVTSANGNYIVKRKSDEKEITATSLPELRTNYFSA